ncbi:MAG: glycerol-3-phosphate acyltransferase, partial [Bdellovibrionales bacterium]|nr:glycerol-3-phosphate acyltransferase [Bdellovibrionales bacterium]
MNFILTFLALIPFYLIGAFPTGMMLAKSQGIDITKKGSGNVGATNIARVIGKKAGIITLLVDVSKGLIGSLIASLFADSYFVPLAGVILVAGHCFSLPPKLKGGKGVATALGVMLFINYTAALTGIGTFIIAFSIWRIVSLASLAGALIVPP